MPISKVQFIRSSIAVEYTRVGFCSNKRNRKIIVVIIVSDCVVTILDYRELCTIASIRLLMTLSPLLAEMPSQARCDRVPPTDGRKWDNFDLRLLQDDDLPLDPRSWGRSEVGTWVSRAGGLPERFPMNGKALCLMSKDMFTNRVPNGGLALYQDFRRRLAKALALQELIEKMTSK